ncbi:MAG TPA: flotillin family protein [Candidatus Paceibacterota bacterium]|nr:flotillin family protein [Verrucomicrobiota bacterium]HRY50218.1 flotillin family protein [Candidatus Paceibacterota bacterium]
MLAVSTFGNVLITFLALIGAVVAAGIAVLVVRCYRKVEQGQALVRTGQGGTKVAFSGMLVFPVIHKAEYINISVHRIEIDRRGTAGLICKDNLRADITVAFFVRINKTENDVLKVAQSIGCQRASNREAIVELFDAKFSEALKTVGRRFDFVELYNSREEFRDTIIKIIGTDLNGFVLEDVAIDYLEQTSLDHLNPNNILDAEGIKKITDLTATQAKLANQITREKEKVITQQNVETQEKILELNRQLAEATEKQKREVATIKAREEAEARKVEFEQKLRSEQARISTEEEVLVAEENKNRQIIVARKNKERTEAVEIERVEKDRLLEANERERVVSLAQIEKTKAVEIEQKKIQDVIRERVMVEKTVVQERERIKDTEAFAAADRQKKVIVTKAEMEAEEGLVKEIKSAEAHKKAIELTAEAEKFRLVKQAEAAKSSAEIHAEETIIKAQAGLKSAELDATAKKTLAQAITAETAAPGLGEAQVQEAKAQALEKQGTTEAKIMQLKFQSEADGIKQKAESMKLLDGVGRDHEEFKLRLNKERDVELASIQIQKDIASSQALVVSEALRHSRIDIVGGDAAFFDKIVGAISAGKAVDRLLDNSQALSDIKQTLFNGNPDQFRQQLKSWISQFGLTTEDLKNLTLAAALTRMMTLNTEPKTKGLLNRLLEWAQQQGLHNQKVSQFLETQS